MFWSFVDTSHNPHTDNIYYLSNTDNFDKDKTFANFHSAKEYALTNKLAFDVKINPNIKVAVLTQSYYRRNGKSRENLLNVFKMLENQKYKNFKLFLIGDNYQPKKEFDEICKLYKGDIFYENNSYSCRELKLGLRTNYWTTGGVLAMKKGYEKIKEEGFDIVLMLDDDDKWFEEHVFNIVWGFSNYPNAAFIITKARYLKTYLPKTNVTHIDYNNYIARHGDSVRSASAHNIKYIYEDQHSLIENIKVLLKKIHKNNTDKDGSDITYIKPCDGQLLSIIGNNVRNGKYKMLYLPWITVQKDSDQNLPI